ncbi:MAG: DUF3795 domain-containing protein [Bacillota bacterium]|nr:DUF3795 domain-containing protein [Bacillota bacterium]
MEYIFDTYCGLYCGACEVLLVNRKGTVEKAAKIWKMDPHNLKCTGCKTDTVSVFCKNCQIRSCALDKGVNFCFQCHNYPCKELVDFNNDEHPHHLIVLRNLEAISKKGIEYWLKEQENRWSCPECGEKFSWYDEKCPICGSCLRSCLDDEKELDR